MEPIVHSRYLSSRFREIKLLFNIAHILPFTQTNFVDLFCTDLYIYKNNNSVTENVQTFLNSDSRPNEVCLGNLSKKHRVKFSSV